MKVKVSKDGQTFYEIENSPDEMQKAEAKGYRSYMDVTKDGETVFTIPAEGSELIKAQEKGYLSVDAFGKKASGQNISKKMSAALGAAGSMAWGQDDEAAAGLTSIYQDMKQAFSGGKDPSKPMPTYDEHGRVSNPEELTGNYAKNKADINRVKGEAWDANPGTSVTSSIVGGLATPGLVALKALSLPGRIGAGMAAGGSAASLQAVGDAETMDDIPGDVFKKGFIGAGIGGLLGGVIRPGKTTEELGELGGKALKTGKAALSGWREGVRSVDADDTVTHLPIWQAIVKTARGSKNAIKGIGDLFEGQNDFMSMVSKTRSGGAGGGGAGRGNSFMDDAPDEIYALTKMLEDGPNPIKEWMAKKAAAAYPGQIDAKSYQNLLERPMDHRLAAAMLDKKEVGRDLKPLFDQAQDLFKKSIGQRYGELQGQARDGFARTKQADKVLKDLAELRDKFLNDEATSDGKAMQTIVKDAIDMLTQGRALPSESKLKNISPGGWLDVDDTQRFNRLQATRERLDRSLPYGSDKKYSPAQMELQSIRNKIDKVLKISPEKAEADQLYAKAQDINKNFFGPLTHGKGRDRKIDRFKIARMFNDNDSAGRFKDYLSEVEEFVKRPDLPADIKKDMQILLKEIEQTIGIADLQRQQTNFRYKQGPTSPAMERQTAIFDKTRPMKDAINAPAGFLKSSQEFNAILKDMTGKNFTDFNQSEKNAAVKWWIWIRNNEADYDGKEAAKMYRKFMKEAIP